MCSRLKLSKTEENVNKVVLLMDKMLHLEANILLQRENELKIKFDIQHPDNPKFLTLTSDKYLCGAVFFQLQAYSVRCDSSPTSRSYVDGHIVILIKFMKMLKDDNLLYKCNFSSIAMDLQNVTFSEHDVWHYIFHFNRSQIESSTKFSYSFDVAVQFDLITNPSPFASLYEDTDLCDFELRVKEGSVTVHSAILAGFSPYFKTLFTGDWKENSDGYVTVRGTTKETLEHFKDYIYLNKLPEGNMTDIQQLLLLGCYYMMPDLAQKCSVKLLNMLNSGNLMDLIDFAVKFGVNNLLLAIMNVVQSGVVNTEGLSADNWMNVCQSTSALLKK